MSSTSAALISIQAVSPVSACASVAWAQAVPGRQSTAAQRIPPAGRTVGRSMEPDCRIDALRVPQGPDVPRVTPGGLVVFKPISMRHVLTALVLLVGCATASSGTGARASAASAASAGEPLHLPRLTGSSEEQAVHVLNRLAYGPSPADLRQVEAMGPAAWIGWQLRPADIDDTEVEKRLADFPSLSMSTADLVASYPRAKKVAEAKGIQLEGKSPETLRAELAGVVEPFHLP